MASNARPSFGDVLIGARDPATVADAGPDLAGEFERLADLHARGDLTDAEFAAAKAALLGSAADTASVS